MTISPQSPPGASEPGDPDAAPEPRRWRIRWRRHLLFALLSLLLLPVAAIIGALWFAESPAAKVQVRKALKEGFGLDVQWGHLQLRLLSGVHLGELRVLTPPPYDGVEPLLLRARAIDVRWSAWRALRGRRPLIDEIVARDVAVNVVADGRGDSVRALLARLPAEKPSAPAPRRPLSRTLREALPARVAVGRIAIEGLVLSHLRVPGVVAGGPAAAERSALRGLRLEAALRPGAGGLEAELQLGAPGAPLELRLIRTLGAPQDDAGAGGTARAQLQLGATLRGGVVRVTGELRLGKQDLWPALPPVGRVLALTAEARFLPAERRVAVSLERLLVLDGAAEATLRAELPDEGADAGPRIAQAAGRVDLLRLVPFAALALPQGGRLRLGRGQLAFALSGLRLGAAPRLEAGGAVSADGEIGDLQLDAADRSVSLQRAELRARGAQEGDEGRLLVEVPLAGLRAVLSDGTLRLHGVAPSAVATRRSDGPARVEVTLPVSRGHLLELLDLLDPGRERAGLNRARAGLKLGPPQATRFRIDGGPGGVPVTLLLNH